MRISFSVLLCVTLSTSSCVTFPNWTGVARLSPEAFTATNTGVVLFSTGAPGRCLEKATHLEVYDQAARKRVHGRLIAVDSRFFKSDFETHQGLVHALGFPPGTYSLVPRMITPVDPIDVPSFQFDVRAGETTYVGELLMVQSCWTTNVFVIRDRYERDVALAMQKNPAIGGRPIGKSLMRPGPAYLEGGRRMRESHPDSTSGEIR